MVDLKSALEARDKEDSTHMGAPQHVFQVYIRATPERLWQAITDPAMTQIYYFGSHGRVGPAVGSPIQYKQADGSVDIDGEVLEADPPRKLVHSFTSRWEANDDPPSTVTWEITPMGSETCLLSVVHGGFAARERDLQLGQGRLGDHPVRPEDAGGDGREAADRGAGGGRGACLTDPSSDRCDAPVALRPRRIGLRIRT